MFTAGASKICASPGYLHRLREVDIVFNKFEHHSKFSIGNMFDAVTYDAAVIEERSAGMANSRPKREQPSWIH
jgi:hypothetical protein